ncbi:hypothetical protein AJ88_03915 [Mesorhizobium amorphae CCBAU 01583]|nr:hypothetical protein AJ88_03915 [Mesorhizobium amorphae CCBAU 01583]
MKRFSLWVQYDVPWGGIALAVLLITIVLAALATATGILPTGPAASVISDDCFGRGMSLDDTC